VQVRISASPQAVSIAMANTGEPIAPEHWERVFDRFFRVDPSRQRSSEGTGLGLAITQSIVTAHGGRIQVASEGSVTTFTIHLPRHAPEMPQTPQSAAAD
jgi:two-component system heavy metal sensor histidine kinase CusS